MGRKVNSRVWGLRRPIEASKPIGIDLNHSATGTPRRKKYGCRRAKPTFRLKLDIFTANRHPTGAEIFFRNFLSDLLLKPSPIDPTTSNYPRLTFAGSEFAYPWLPWSSPKFAKIFAFFHNFSSFRMHSHSLKRPKAFGIVCSDD